MGIKKERVAICGITPSGECNQSKKFNCGNCPTARNKITTEYKEKDFAGCIITLIKDSNQMIGVLGEISNPPSLDDNAHIVRVKEGKFFDRRNDISLAELITRNKS